MIRRVGIFLLFALTLLGLAAIGYWMLFSNFPGYDDEGYIMLSARDYYVRGHLYDSVYSQYGPAFYVFTDGFQRGLGALVDHTSARLLTLGLWLGTAAACAGLVWQVTRVHGLALFTLGGTFLYLHFMPGEPFHPGTLIVFILAASLWALTGLIATNRPAAAAVVAGATGAILLLTKINVGIFFVVGTAAWALLHAVPDRARRATAAIVGVSLVVFAAVLMHALWHETWIRIYLVLFAAGACALMATWRGEGVAKPRHAGLFSLSFFAAALLILALTWARGTSLAGLIEGVLLAPLRHPTSYSFAANWRPGSLPLAGVSLGLALAMPWIRRRFSDEIADRAVVTLRLAQTAALLVGIAMLVNFRVIGVVFSSVAPLIWIWAIPLRTVEQPRAAHLCRGLLAIVLLLQYLHAYPVGGSQESWGTFLFIPLVALGLDEVRRWDLARNGAAARSSGWWQALAVALVTVVTAKVAWTERFTHLNYAAFAELGLPGAERLRLPEGPRTAYRIVTLNAAVHADVLFSLPGMFSFNLWSGVPTPTEKNTTLWFTLLTDEEQRAIIQSLERSGRPCIILQYYLVGIILGEDIPVRGVLRDYLFENFTQAFRLEDFGFLVRKGRLIAPLNLAHFSRLPAADPALPGAQFDFRLASDGTPIAAIEVQDAASPLAPPLVLNGTNTHVTATQIDSSDRQIGAATTQPWPIAVKGLVHLSVRFDRSRLDAVSSSTVIYLKNSEALTVGEVRFLP